MNFYLCTTLFTFQKGAFAPFYLACSGLTTSLLSLILIRESKGTCKEGL